MPSRAILRIEMGFYIEIILWTLLDSFFRIHVLLVYLTIFTVASIPVGSLFVYPEA